jgi:hypothetical protein
LCGQNRFFFLQLFRLMWLPHLTDFAVSLCEFYFYRLIGKPAVFLQFQELIMDNIIRTSYSFTLTATFFVSFFYFLYQSKVCPCRTVYSCRTVYVIDTF